MPPPLIAVFAESLEDLNVTLESFMYTPPPLIDLVLDSMETLTRVASAKLSMYMPAPQSVAVHPEISVLDISAPLSEV